MTVTEKVAYLKGLIEGLEIDKGSKNGKVFMAMMDILDDLAASVCDLEDEVADVNEHLEAVDEDLNLLEEDYYDDDDEYDDDDDDFDLDDFDLDDEDLNEVICLDCGNTVLLDDDMLHDEEIKCPNCGSRLTLDVDSCNCGECNHNEEPTE